MNPYLIEGPAQISFSGGRSSGMMLCKIVEAHGGKLPDDVVVCFANTGKEREETLRFVQRIGKHLGIYVHWVEFDPLNVWRESAFSVAARRGEPFQQLNERKQFLPNPIARICTQNLKVIPMRRLMEKLGFEEWRNVAGIRADEPHRVARLRGRSDCDFVMPLADAGITKDNVAIFWHTMPFDLGLPSDGYSNCDLCYLKGVNKLLGVIRNEPARADWWIKQEEGGKLFRSDRPNYAVLKIIAMQPQLFDAEEESSLPCECTD